MIIYQEIALADLPFWGPAESHVKNLNDNDIEIIEQELEYAHKTQIGIDKTELNDLFSYDEDYIANILGYDDFEQLKEDRS